MHELEAAPNRVRFDELNSVRADQALCNDGIMPLFCPTSQTGFGESKKPNANKVPATVHGVVFALFYYPVL